MKHLLAFSFACAFILAGCTHNHMVRTSSSASYASLNERSIGQQAMVTLVNGREVAAEKLRVDSDSTSWVDPGTRKEIVVPTKEVSKVRFIRRGKGALQGLGLGLSAGVITGVVLGLSSGDGFFTAEESAVIAGTFFGGLGALIGTPAGAILGSKELYRFEQKDSQPSTQK